MACVKNETRIPNAAPNAPIPIWINIYDEPIATLLHIILVRHHVHIFALLEIDTPNIVDADVKIQETAMIINGFVSVNSSP